MVSAPFSGWPKEPEMAGCSKSQNGYFGDKMIRMGLCDTCVPNKDDLIDKSLHLQLHSSQATAQFTTNEKRIIQSLGQLRAFSQCCSQAVPLRTCPEVWYRISKFSRLGWNDEGADLILSQTRTLGHAQREQFRRQLFVHCSPDSNDFPPQTKGTAINV